MSQEALTNAKGVLESRIGQVGTPTDWFEMTQERINAFADATMDHQWIHVDEERAKNGPFGTTIAHGQLTMSVMMFLPGAEGVGIPRLDGVKMGVNMGWNKVRFPSPVPVGARIRTVPKLIGVSVKGENMLEAVNELTVEVEGSEKPACVAQSVLRMVF